MAEPLFSDIPVGGASNFQSRVDKMCGEINDINEARSNEEKGVPVSFNLTSEEVEKEVIEEKKVNEDDTLSKLTT